MRNSVYACNLENKIAGICSEIDRDCVRYLTTHHTYNQAPHIKEKFVLTDVLSADGESIKQIKTHTFAYPDVKKDKTSIKSAVTKRTMNKKLCYVDHGTERICYTINNDDMNFVIEQKNIFISEIAKPKTKKPQRKKYVRRSRMANLIKWEDLCFQQEIEAEYHCNVKPNDYAQYLNNPQQDPMFCQFDVQEKLFFDFYMGK